MRGRVPAWAKEGSQLVSYGHAFSGPAEANETERVQPPTSSLTMRMSTPSTSSLFSGEESASCRQRRQGSHEQLAVAQGDQNSFRAGCMHAYDQDTHNCLKVSRYCSRASGCSRLNLPDEGQ